MSLPVSQAASQDSFGPLVSIIIPVYNRADYICQALDSVLAESYPNKEIVVIDDGSTDDTRQVIEAWIIAHGERIPVQLYSRPNKGFVPTLNELIVRANGDYILFFGSDDYLLNDGIQKRYDYLQAHPEKLMVLGDCELVDATGQRLHNSAYQALGHADTSGLTTDHGLKKFMILNGYVPGATLMARKRAYQIFGLYDESMSAEDWVYYIRVVATDQLGFLDQVVSAYRRHDNNMCFSPVQLTIAQEQLGLMFRLLPAFRGVYRLYLLRRIGFQHAYIPYLALKFRLMAHGETQATAMLSAIKRQVMRLAGPAFARQT